MSLCLSCGLCCDGTMFELAALTAAEASRYGDRVNVSADGRHLTLPCPALDGCKCTTYLDRPAICSDFKCLPLASLDEGLMTEAQAQEAIAEVRGRRRAVAELMGSKVLARKKAGAGAASPELVSALARLNRALMVMLLRPEDVRGKNQSAAWPKDS